MNAARALARTVPDEELCCTHILPDLFDAGVAPAVAEAVARTLTVADLARIERARDEVGEKSKTYAWSRRFTLPAYPTAAQEGSTPKERALNLRIRHNGVMAIQNKVKSFDKKIRSHLLLPPYDTESVKRIMNDPHGPYYYTARNNLVAVVTDGTAVLGLGDIGGGAGLPVMEGKAVLFKTLAGVEAAPICLATKDPEELIELTKLIAPTFGGVNLEDISAPRCFEIEARLKKECDIPIFHDDQHGTAIVVLAAMINGLRLTGNKLEQLKVVMNGAGAAGMAICKLLISAGLKNVILCDRNGPIYQGRPVGMNSVKEEMARITNPEVVKGTLADALKGANVFIGVSAPGQVTQDMVRTMAKNPMIMAMANPTPEIMPDEAKAAGAAIVATGRSDFKNQVNNCLAFPGVFRGALDVRAKDINESMKVAAAYAIANLVTEKELNPDYIIPASMDLRVSPKVAGAVAKAALESGVAQIMVDPEVIEANTRSYIYEDYLGPLPE
jgi:malate dehydrogenase (oxaloacetate-decarboxylating)